VELSHEVERYLPTRAAKWAAWLTAAASAGGMALPAYLAQHGLWPASSGLPMILSQAVGLLLPFGIGMLVIAVLLIIETRALRRRLQECEGRSFWEMA
jgi:TRAP-type C4-dicarboxylate transport system permease small subunit